MPDLQDSLETTLGQSVSRETVDRLETHLALLRKWNPAINLVSDSTLETGWSRHIVDSAQVFGKTPGIFNHWLDFGTGGGFPGLVCATLAAELRPEATFTLVESDKRKAAFLLNAIRELRLRTNVVSRRIESLAPQDADVITARAVAQLTTLLDYALPHLATGGICVFPKGVRHKEEVREARRNWRFKLEENPSITDPNSAILVLGEIERV